MQRLMDTYQSRHDVDVGVADGGDGTLAVDQRVEHGGLLADLGMLDGGEEAAIRNERRGRATK